MNLYQSIHRNAGRQQIDESRQSKQGALHYNNKDENDNIEQGSFH